MVALSELAERVEGRSDLVKFIGELRRVLLVDPQSWENRDLESFLEALAAWTQSMDGAYSNRGEALPETPTWKMMAEMLLAASIYE